MNWIKKHLKWIILGITILIAVIIAIIDYTQIYVALTLIPSVLLSFLQSNNEKQEKLAAMRIAEKEKQQKEKEQQEKFEKMLDFVLSTLIKNDNLTTLTEIEKQIVNIKLSNNLPIEILIMQYNGGHLTYSGVRCNKEKAENFYKNLHNRDASGRKFIDILKQELPKILTPDVFDGEKLIV